MEYGYAQMSQIKTTELVAEADRHRLVKEARAARRASSPRTHRSRSVRAALAATVLSLVIVLGFSSAAFARPVKDDPFFERNGRAPIVEVDESTSSAGFDATVVVAVGAALVLGLGTVALVRAQRTRPKTS